MGRPGAGGVRAGGPGPGSVLEPKAGSTSSRTFEEAQVERPRRDLAGTCRPFVLGFGRWPSCALVRIGRRSPAHDCKPNRSEAPGVVGGDDRDLAGAGRQAGRLS